MANVLLLHCDGTDASTTFTDSSSFAHTVTASGNAQIDTAQSKFGSASALFDGTLDYLDTGTGADGSLGTGDFTVDFWIRFASVDINTALIGNRRNPVGVATEFAIKIDDDGGSAGLCVHSGAASVFDSTVAFSIDTWYHIAIVRTSGVLKYFRDGTQEVSTAFTNDLSSAEDFSVAGNDVFLIDSLNGWMEEIRILKGYAAWTANFTPPTAPYTGENTIVAAQGSFTYTGQTADLIEFGDTSVVQSKALVTATTLGLTLDGAPAQNNWLIAFITDNSSTPPTANTNWTRQTVTIGGDAENAVRPFVYYKRCAAAESATQQPCSTASSGASTVIIVEVTGLGANWSSFFQAITANEYSNSTNFTSADPKSTAAVGPSLVLVGVGYRSSAAPTNIGALSGVSTDQGGDNDATVNRACASGYSIVGDTQQVDCNPTFTGIDQNSIAYVVLNANSVVSYTMAAAQAAFSFTGQAVTGTLAWLMAAAQGAYSFTGQVAELGRQFTLDAANAAFGLTGQVITGIKAVLIAAGFGSFGFSGQNADLTLNPHEYRMKAETGMFAYRNSWHSPNPDWGIRRRPNKWWASLLNG